MTHTPMPTKPNVTLIQIVSKDLSVKIKETIVSLHTQYPNELFTVSDITATMLTRHHLDLSLSLSFPAFSKVTSIASSLITNGIKNGTYVKSEFKIRPQLATIIFPNFILKAALSYGMNPLPAPIKPIKNRAIPKINKDEYLKISAGLSKKIKTTLMTIQGTNESTYLTVADIVVEMLERTHSNLLPLDYGTFLAVAKLASNALNTAVKHGGVRLSDFKQYPTLVYTWYPNRPTRAAVAYRFGPVDRLLKDALIPVVEINDKSDTVSTKVKSSSLLPDHVNAELQTTGMDESVSKVDAVVKQLSSLSMVDLTKVIIKAMGLKDQIYLNFQRDVFKSALDE